MDEKFNSLTTKLEKRIYTCLLKPTVEKLENTLKGNLNELKIHLKNIERKKKIGADKNRNKKDKSKSKGRVLDKERELFKAERISETMEKLAKKLERKEKIIKELDKKVSKTVTGTMRQPKLGSFNLSINSFTDTFSDI